MDDGSRGDMKPDGRSKKGTDPFGNHNLSPGSVPLPKIKYKMKAPIWP